MKYKEILSKENIRENQIESGMVNDGRTGSIAIGLEDGVSLNLYVVSVNAAGGRSEDIIFGKLMDSDASVDDILSDRESLAEVSRQWPLFYGMLMAGVKDVYSDTAIIRLDDQLVLATKIDLDRAEHGDRKDYLGDKAALLLCLGVFVLSAVFDISPVLFVVFCAAAGILFTRLGVRGK